MSKTPKLRLLAVLLALGALTACTDATGPAIVPSTSAKTATITADSTAAATMTVQADGEGQGWSN